MLSAPFAYVVAFTMLGVCGLVAVTFVKVVNSFDPPEPQREPKPEMHATAA